jgi:hypothetical protein
MLQKKTNRLARNKNYTQIKESKEVTINQDATQGRNLSPNLTSMFTKS